MIFQVNFQLYSCVFDSQQYSYVQALLKQEGMGIILKTGYFQLWFLCKSEGGGEIS